MIDVNEYIKKAIKKEIFSEEYQNKAVRQVLSEVKTKYIDIKEEIDSKVQYKLLKKMESERMKSIEIYSKVPEGANNLMKESNELYIIRYFLEELEKDMPKQLSKEEIEKIIDSNNFSNIGECMRWFKDNYPDQDKKMISEIMRSK